MICILSIKNNDVTGWIVATDLSDAIYQAHGNLNSELVDALQESDEPSSGKHILKTGHIMIIT